MAGPAPKTKDWSARENKHKPKGLHVIVSGLVEVSTTGKQAVLKEAPRVGKVLPLDLRIKDGKVKDPKPIMVWTEAYYHKEVSANEFDRVEIRWDRKTIATAPVIDDTERHAQLNKQMAGLNTKSAGLEPPKPTDRVVEMRAAAKAGAKKAAAAAKKAAAKKGAKKAAAKKKAAPNKAKKKAAKKAAKKTAKKSTLSKMFRRVVKKLTPSKKKKR
jgi:hypothetical protein